MNNKEKEFKIKCLKTGGKVKINECVNFSIRMEYFVRKELNELGQEYPDASLNSIINIAIHNLWTTIKKEKEK